MKLHQDGTIEGTPEEIASFMKLKDPMFGKVYVPLGSQTGQPYSPPQTNITSIVSGMQGVTAHN